MEYMMAKKARKRLGQDIKVKDVLLLDRPEVEVLEALKPTKKYHKAPEGQILKVRDKNTKVEYEIYVGANEKVDVTYRPSMWDKFKSWLDRNHKKHLERKASDAIPPLFK
jgi:hypothetical protein